MHNSAVFQWYILVGSYGVFRILIHGSTFFLNNYTIISLIFCCYVAIYRAIHMDM